MYSEEGKYPITLFTTCIDLSKSKKRRPKSISREDECGQYQIMELARVSLNERNEEENKQLADKYYVKMKDKLPDLKSLDQIYDIDEKWDMVQHLNEKYKECEENFKRIKKTLKEKIESLSKSMQE